MYEKDNNKYKETTYKEFIEESLSIANYFITNNYKNKTFFILSENSIKLMECDLAISFYVGKSAIACREWPIEDLEDGIDEIKADVILCSKKYEEIASSLSEIKSIPYYRMDKISFSFNKSYLDFKIKNYNDVAKIVFSSGTTGRSKGVLLSLKNIFSGYNSLQRRCHITHEDIVYMFLPLHHTYASICHFMYSLLTGHRLYLSSSTSNIGKELLEVNPTIFCTVPLVLNKLYDVYSDSIDKAFGNRIKYIICGGAPLSKKLRKIFKDKNMVLMQTYALTEASSAFSLAYPYHEDLASCGELYEDIEVKIINQDSNGVGEIIVRGDNVFLGYTDRTLTKKVIDPENFFHTGDLGYIKDNKIYIKGRKKKMLLTSNGENIDARALEAKIKKLSNKINEVKSYIKDDLIAINIYVTGNDNYKELIDTYNNKVPKFEKISYFRIYKDSIDSRMKQ